jgi:hypothetical protein
MDTEDFCSICMESNNLDKIKTSCCKQDIHKSCYDKSIICCNNSCPFCRKVINVTTNPLNSVIVPINNLELATINNLTRTNAHEPIRRTVWTPLQKNEIICFKICFIMFIFCMFIYMMVKMSLQPH